MELSCSDSVLIFTRRKYSNIVIGVPHHAPAGVETLPCPKHPVADENAGFIGEYIADALEVASVIACNYPIDPNKEMFTDYSQIIISLKPQFLIEIHGHSKGSTNFDVEISSGKRSDQKSQLFANAITTESQRIDALKDITVSGDFEKIKLKANKSKTITTDLWTSFHIELPSELRIPNCKNSIKPPFEAYYFADCIVKAIKIIVSQDVNRDHIERSEKKD